MLAFVAPGPRVTKQIPGRPVSLPQASAMKDDTPSLSTYDETYLIAGIVQSIQHREITFPGHTEGQFHTVGLECLDEDLSAVGSTEV